MNKIKIFGYYIIFSSICGMVFSVGALSDAWGILALCLINVLGFAMGMRMVKQSIIHRKQLLPFLLLQVPAFKSQVATYMVTSGLGFYLFPAAWSEESRAGVQLAFSFGKILFSNDFTGWSFGINFVPLLMLLLVLLASPKLFQSPASTENAA